MPARTVVLTDCEKPSGDKNGSGRFMRSLMPNEFHQMSGRAGRRGIDTIGHVICLSDSDEKTQIYKNLIRSGPNSIQSNFKIDASSVANFYEITTDRQYIDHILDKTFGLYSVPEAERKEKRDGFIKDFEDYSRLLAMYRFIQPAENGYSTTSRGVLINRIQGRPQIPVIQSIFKQVYKDIDAVELAGLLSAMTLPLAYEETRINQGIKILARESEINLEAINQHINDILRNELHIKKDKLDAKNRTNDQIMKYIRDRYGFVLTKSLDDLRYEYDLIGKKIKIKIKESAKRGYSEDSVKEIAKLHAREKQLKEAINVNKYYRIVKSLLERRIVLQSVDKIVPSDYYNVIQDIFNKYNHNVDTLQNKNIRYARLNPTVYEFVKKWAELNSQSEDYKKNWDIICDMLKNTGSVRFEGDIFNAVAQTIDFVHQFETVLSDIMKTTKDEPLYYSCSELKQKCRQVVKLLKRPPVYAPDEIKRY